MTASNTAATRWFGDGQARERAAVEFAMANPMAPLDEGLVQPGHEHDWKYHPPATVGAMGVRHCPGCGRYADPLPSDGVRVV